MEHDDLIGVHSYRGQTLEEGEAAGAPATIVAAMLRNAADRPEAPYITGIAADPLLGQVLTYGALEQRSRCLAWWLHRELGLRVGDRIAILPRNDIDSVVAVFALLRAGCGVFFINSAEPTKRLEELLAGFPVLHVLSTSAAVADRLPQVRLLPETASLLCPGHDEYADAPLRPGASALFFGTSGSTATSKVVAQMHRNATANAEALRRHHGLGPGVCLLGCLPIHHVNGLHFTVFGTLWAGGHAVLMEAFNPLLYQQCLHEFRPAIASVVPSLLEVLLSTGIPLELPAGFRYFVSAAAPLSTATCRAVHHRLGARVNQGYGLTETTNFSTTMPPQISDQTYRKLMLDTDIPSIGIALHGNEMAVLRPDGTRAAPLEVGEICMRGHNVMREYVGNEASTAEAFQGGWFHSQDLGYTVMDDEYGLEFFVITGRLKNMAKVMGAAVSLEEMERALRKLEHVSDAACFTIPDELMGEAIVAAVVSAQALDPASLNDHLANYFHLAALPVRYVHAEQIPRTATGKILRPQLRAAFA